MTIPSMPTDNLYKFITILGIVIFAVSLYGAISFNEKAIERALNMEVEYQKLDPQSDRAKELSKLSAVIATEDLKNQKFSVGIAAMGLVISVIGIIIWYFKHQRYLDQIVRLEYEEAKLKVKTNPA